MGLVQPRSAWLGNAAGMVGALPRQPAGDGVSAWAAESACSLYEPFGAKPINTELSMPALVSEQSLIALLFSSPPRALSLLHVPGGSSAMAT